MAQWTVTQGSHQFQVAGMADLKRLCRAGDLRAGDMVQPPGTSEWMYIVEIPELKALVDLDDGGGTRGISNAAIAGVAAVLGAVTVAAGGAAVWLALQVPADDGPMIGEGGLQYSEMLVTATGASLLAEPSASAAPVAPVQKDQAVDLLAKRGDFYKARTKSGGEGWIAVDAVLPIYQLGGAEVKAELDPLYNPDRYLNVANASWTQPQEQKETDQLVTVFNFMLENTSGYLMTDLVLQAAIKDAKGHELEVVTIPVRGEVPPHATTMIGTLAPEAPKKGKRAAEDAEPAVVLTESTFLKMSESDPDLQLRYTAGAEVQMRTPDFTTATVTLVQLRSVPDAAAAAVVAPAE